jgi:nucleoside-diphosphate-sugar epimerase
MSDNEAIPRGSWILLSGATGYIGSQIILYLLKRGYKVRGTVRDIKGSAWVTEELFPAYAASGSFELVEVNDIASAGAFDEAIKGMSGVIHLATIGTMSPNPNEVIPQTVQAALNALEAAVKEPKVKSFVFTTSLVAMTIPLPDVEFHVDSNSWNDAIGPIAWAPPPYDPSRSMIVYMQSKVEAEKAVWKFVEEKKPEFSVNTVSPTSVLGPVLHQRLWRTTANWIKMLWNGEVEFIKSLTASKFNLPEYL